MNREQRRKARLTSKGYAQLKAEAQEAADERGCKCEVEITAARRSKTVGRDFYYDIEVAHADGCPHKWGGDTGPAGVRVISRAGGTTNEA